MSTRRRVTDLLTLMLTEVEANAVLLAAGNSTSDPAWWNSYGKGNRAAHGRGVSKLLRQEQWRRKDHPRRDGHIAAEGDG